MDTENFSTANVHLASGYWCNVVRTLSKMAPIVKLSSTPTQLDAGHKKWRVIYQNVDLLIV